MNKLKESLKKGEISFGTWIQIPSSPVVEIIVESFNGKLDWICIDMEHGLIGMESMVNLIVTIEKYGITPFVRIPKNDYIWIHRVLDAGAKGLIIPMIKNEMEALKAVSESFYPPLGKRSFGYSRANSYGAKFDEYINSVNEEISVIIQIEHIHAINRIEEILDIKNIDGTFIGPYDLSGSIGDPGNFENKEYEDVLSIYESVSKSLCKPMGSHLVRPTKEKVDELISRCYQIIAIGIDTVFLEERCKDVYKYIKI